MFLILVRYILKAALRDRLFRSMAALSVLGACLSLFSGSVAIIEQNQFVLSYMAGGLRVISLLALTLFVVFFVRRSFDSRDVEFLLTRPVSRLKFVLAHGAAFSLLSAGAGAGITLLLFLLSPVIADKGAFFLWSAGMTVELILVSNTAFFFSMVLTSPVTAGLATFGFYILARLTGQLLAIAHAAPNVDSVSDFVYKGLGGLIQVISVVIPRFDLLAQTSWLIDGGGVFADWIFIVCQGLAYLFLLYTATTLDLKRRQF